MSQEFKTRLLQRTVAAANGCLEWVGALDGRGYGSVNVGGKVQKAHRLMWAAVHGPIPEGLFVCHRCDNRKCINTEHLFLGRPADNTQDMVQKQRGLVGEKNGMARLRPEDVLLIRKALAAGESQRSIARRFSVDQPAISFIKTGRTWGHLVG